MTSFYPHKDNGLPLFDGPRSGNKSLIYVDVGGGNKLITDQIMTIFYNQGSDGEPVEKDGTPVFQPTVAIRVS